MTTESESIRLLRKFADEGDSWSIRTLARVEAADDPQGELVKALKEAFELALEVFRILGPLLPVGSLQVPDSDA